LSSKEWLNHNTLKLRFNLPNPKQRLGLPIGQHISFRAKDSDGKDVYRSYTPVSDDDLLGAVEFVIKIYPNGKMSQVLKQLEVGQTLDMKGPKVGREASSAVGVLQMACTVALRWHLLQLDAPLGLCFPAC
jgi:cytochrome-b5 reductase